jgi:Polyketide cyclase / dehydrase and lipid transport
LVQLQPSAPFLLNRAEGSSLSSTFTNTVTVQRPAHVVFAYLAQFENLPSWNYAIDSTRKVTPGPVGVGTVYHQTRSIPRPSEESFVVTALDPDRRLAIDGEVGPFRAQIDYVLDPAGTATTLVNTVVLSQSGLLSLVTPLAIRQVKAAVAANLDVLKSLLEAAGPAE